MPYRRRTSKRIGTRSIRRKAKASGFSKGPKAKMNGLAGHGQIGDLNAQIKTKNVRATKCPRSVDAKVRNDCIVSLAEVFPDKGD